MELKRKLNRIYLKDTSVRNKNNKNKKITTLHY